MVQGITPSERYLSFLCSQTFLKLWSYPNLYNDKGIERLKRGQELCDLLVVFGDDIVIFSDKSCAFPSHANINVAWKRWYCRAIADSAGQIFGAERWIKTFPDRVFVDALCKRRIPIALPSVSTARIHRVVVALGAEEAAEKHFGGGSSGSLMLFNWIEDKAHTSDDCKPFVVGQINKAKGFVHVFDDVSLTKVMTELDTVRDFIGYLTAKEEFLTQHDLVMVHGEEELLAFYLSKPGNDGKPIFPSKSDTPPKTALVVSEGLWDVYDGGPIAKFRRRMASDGIFIDRLIEHFSQHILSGELAFGADDSISEQERNVRFLAAEPRHHRALMSKLILEKVGRTPANARSSILIASSNLNVQYVFLLLPRSEGQTESEYRLERQATLQAYCWVTKHKANNARFVVGLATEPGPPGTQRSEDLMSFDFEHWDAEAEELAKEAAADMSILIDVRPMQSVDYYRSIWPERLESRNERRAKRTAQKRARKRQRHK